MCTHLQLYLCIHILSVRECLLVCTCMFVYVCVFVYACVCTYVSVYVHIEHIEFVVCACICVHMFFVGVCTDVRLVSFKGQTLPHCQVFIAL